MENDVEQMEDVNKFLEATLFNRRLQERDRDYYNHNQWTESEIANLKARGQAAIIVNRVKPKVEGLVGMYILRASDPKAYPRTQKHDEAAHAVTDALRFVTENNDFADLKSDVAADFFIEGEAGVIVDVQENGAGEVEVNIGHIPWDSLFYDPYSRKKDYSDARYKGMMMWMSTDEIKEKFPKADIDAIMSQGNGGDEWDFEDKPDWIDTRGKRARLTLKFYIHKSTWMMSIFAGKVDVVKPQESPYLDEFGQPSCPIEIVCANIDRDNQRYGEVRGFISQQDEINHRRSKALHLLSQRQTFGRKGEQKDVKSIKRELAKPNGHVEFIGETFGKDFGVLPTGDMAQGQFLLYQDAKTELDAVSLNAQLSGERQSGDLSGRAIEKLQGAGALELNRQYQLLNNWEKRVYRQIWARVKQFWNEEKWIRVTDNQDNLRWVGLNYKVTAQDWLEEQVNDESLDIEVRKQAAASFQFLMSAAQNPETAQQAQEKLQEIVTIKNNTTELDVDIILEQSFDTINAQQEQFSQLLQFAQGADVDIIELIDLSNIRGKDEIIEKIEARRQAAAQAAGDVAQKESQALEVKNAKTFAEAQYTTKKAEQLSIENISLLNSPDENPQVIV